MSDRQIEIEERLTPQKIKFSDESSLLNRPFFSQKIMAHCHREFGAQSLLKQRVILRFVKTALFLLLVLFPAMTEAI